MGENIRVMCRFRPAMEHEKREEKLQNLVPDKLIFKSTQQVLLARNDPSKRDNKFKCVLDHLFEESSSQADVFQKMGKPLVARCLEGYNATIFAYGQTGSGKTWTMFGPNKRKNQKDLGLVQRCCSYLFEKLKKLSKSGGELRDWQMTASFIQIYKEHLSDLLEPKKKQRLQIKTNFQTDTPYVENLKKVTVSDIGDLLISLGEAFSNRVVASHALNSTSSRSHMLLMIELEQQMKDGSVKNSKLNFGDLAGSEDIRKALGKNPDKDRLAEAISINSTLTALTTAIHALSKGQRPSYRSSSLTHILQDSLGGNSKTTMIVNASPHVMNRNETIRTLRFAMTAKTVKNKARVNKLLTRAQLLRRIEELEGMNLKLKTRVIELETTMKKNGLTVTISKELYDTQVVSGSSDESDMDNEYKNSNSNTNGGNNIVSNGGSGGKKKMIKGKNIQMQQDIKKKKFQSGNKLQISQDKAKKVFSSGKNVAMSQDSSFNMNQLKQEIDQLNDKLKKQAKSTDEYQKKIRELTMDMDSMSNDLQSKNEEIESQLKKIKLFGKERKDYEHRIEDLTTELTKQQNTKTKEHNELDKQIARQRTNLQMHVKQKKDLQKQIKQLKVENDQFGNENGQLQDQIKSLTKQLKNAKKANKLNNNNNNNNEYNDDDDQKYQNNMKKKLNQMVLTEEEKNMSPTKLLLHKFAETELSDHRLSDEQRLKRTAQMMDELTSDIGNLMDTWLPKKKVRKDRMKSKQLVFSVRSLIGQFNVLVNQMKMTENTFQNDLKLDLKRRDAEIKKLKADNNRVLQLQDDLAEREEQIERLQKDLTNIKFERDQLKNQTNEQKDIINDVKAQVKFLTIENERRNPSLMNINMLDAKKRKSRGTAQIPTLDVINDDEYNDAINDDNDDTYDVESIHTDDDYDDNNSSIKPTNNSSKVNNRSRKKSKSKSKTNKFSNNHSPTTNDMRSVNNDEKGDDTFDDGVAFKPNIKPSNAKRKRTRKETVDMWRDNLKFGDQLDCKDDNNIWWTAKIVGFVNQNKNKLIVRIDGWGDNYDVKVDRDSDRLAFFRSQHKIKKKGNSNIIKAGKMYKEGKMFKTWRVRWFTLNDEGKVSYYHNENDDQAISSFSILKMIKTERNTFGKNRKYGLTIHTSDRIWKFAVDTEQDVNDWIWALNSVKDRQYDE